MDSAWPVTYDLIPCMTILHWKKKIDRIGYKIRQLRPENPPMEFQKLKSTPDMDSAHPITYNLIPNMTI